MVVGAEPDMAVVGEAGDGQAGIDLVAERKPDVVLMDVRMPGMDGVAATREIVSAWPGCRVIILTTFDLDDYAFAAIRAGASGFLLKNVQPAELLAAIRAVSSGDASMSPRVTRRMLDLLAPALPALQQDAPHRHAGVLATLTAREREVLAALAEGLANQEIAERFFVAETTVKTHVGRILAKLRVRDRVQAVVLAFESGLVRPRL
ncbi:response regulator transcription factor [Arthrobacter sp. I2-34]|uniref:Response regulator transcription factor n=2 Tax=Arthrobacter hankyongi TaxID=2904801 RepID=A0ABS9L7L1_9MICC|nr:response regulator transcription factor [Arthrobacter hankyongi]